jgi:hypothetical protein
MSTNKVWPGSWTAAEASSAAQLFCVPLMTLLLLSINAAKRYKLVLPAPVIAAGRLDTRSLVYVSLRLIRQVLVHSAINEGSPVCP